MNRFLKMSLYIVYLIAATGVFLYIQFPSETFSRYLSSFIESSYPGIQITIARMRPTLPPGLSIASGAVFYQDVPLVHADTIRFRPMFLSLFKPDMQVQFQGAAHAGRFSGSVEFAKNSRPMRYRVDAGLSGIEMQEIPIVKNLTGSRLSGKCDGRIEFSTDGKVEKASAKMKSFSCKLSLASPIAKLESLSFQQVLADLSLDRGRVEIKEVLFKGPQIDGRLSGNIVLQRPIGKSVMKLSGEMKPHPGFFTELGGPMSTQLLSRRSQGDTKITFTIEGAIENPIFYLN
jgi:type II secretion system protein N